MSAASGSFLLSPVGSVCGLGPWACLAGTHSWLPSPPPLENKQKFCSCRPPGKESTGILKRQLMFATTDLAEHCSFQLHSLPLAPSPPAAFCGFSFISCFSFSLELSVRAEVQIKLQLRCALLGIMELALCVSAR